MSATAKQHRRNGQVRSPAVTPGTRAIAQGLDRSARELERKGREMLDEASRARAASRELVPKRGRKPGTQRRR